MTDPRMESHRSDNRLAEFLLEGAKLDRQALERTRRIALSTGERLPELVLKLGLMAERDLATALAELHGCPLVGPDDWPDLPPLEELVNPRFLSEVRVVPLRLDDGGLELAMADPGDTYARDAMAMIAGVRVLPHVAAPGDIERAIERLYGAGGPDEGSDAEAISNDDRDIERLKDLASEAPVIRLVNRMISRAIDTSKLLRTTCDCAIVWMAC